MSSQSLQIVLEVFGEADEVEVFETVGAVEEDVLELSDHHIPCSELGQGHVGRFERLMVRFVRGRRCAPEVVPASDPLDRISHPHHQVCVAGCTPQLGRAKMAVGGAVRPAVDEEIVVDRDEVIAVLLFERSTERPTRCLRKVDADEFETARSEAAEAVAKRRTQRSPIGT